MDWLRSHGKPPATPTNTEPEYTIDTVRDHLESIGMTRLKIRSATMKLALTLIAWNGEAYLERQSATGKPSGANIVTFCKQLETVRRVIDEFCRIEPNPRGFANYDDLLAQGIKAVQDFALRLAGAVDGPASSAHLTGYVVDTKLLSGNI